MARATGRSTKTPPASFAAKRKPPIPLSYDPPIDSDSDADVDADAEGEGENENAEHTPPPPPATIQIQSQPSRTTARRINDIERQQAIEMRQRGSSLTDIAATIATSMPTVQRILEKAGLDAGRRGSNSKKVPQIPQVQVLNDLHKRLIQLAMTYLSDGSTSLDENEVSELQRILKEKTDERMKVARIKADAIMYEARFQSLLDI